MTNAYHTLDFPLRDNLPAQSIDFLPHGTRTLKIRVTNPDQVKGKFVMRSANVPKGFGKQLFYSHEEGGENFRISWGGGQEKGVCLRGEDVKAEEKKIPIRVCRDLDGESFIYLNVTHVAGPNDKPYTLLLGVFEVEESVEADPVYSLEITLTPPSQIKDRKVTDPIRLVRDRARYQFKGTEVPSYVNRWWSSPVCRSQ